MSSLYDTGQTPVEPLTSGTGDSDEKARQERLRVLMQQLIDGFNLTPFNQHIGFRVTGIDADEVRASLDMQPCLVGNVFKQILHGGVIATMLDNVGGLAALTAAYVRLKGQPREEKMRRIGQLGTIDMRIDYLRPGRGARFEAIGRVVRVGSKICATQMELRNDSGELIATGNAVFHY